MPRPPKKKPATSTVSRRVIYALSDSTGNLGRHMLSAFLTQFPPGALTTRYENFLRTELRLTEALERARQEKAVVCHAVVSPTMKALVESFCKTHHLPCRDLTGGTVEFLTTHCDLAPCTDIQALHRIDDAYERRIDALEFTLCHDDGLGTDTLLEADVILAGVSRTSKTPTSIYLAQQGYRVANVALAMEVDPPIQLLQAPAKKVVGLTINPQQLVMIRARRQQGWQMEGTSYSEPGHVSRELAWARRLFTQRGWHLLDITDQSIEETAAKVVDMVGPVTRQSVGGMA